MAKGAGIRRMRNGFDAVEWRPEKNRFLRARGR